MTFYTVKNFFEFQEKLLLETQDNEKLVEESRRELVKVQVSFEILYFSGGRRGSNILKCFLWNAIAEK